MQKFFRLQFFYATEKKKKVSKTIFSIMFSRCFKSVSDRKHRSIPRQTFPRGRFLIGIALCLIFCSTTCQENCEKKGERRETFRFGQRLWGFWKDSCAAVAGPNLLCWVKHYGGAGFLIVHRYSISGRIWQAKVRKSGTVWASGLTWCWSKRSQLQTYLSHICTPGVHHAHKCYESFIDSWYSYWTTSCIYSVIRNEFARKLQEILNSFTKRIWTKFS